MFIRNVAGVWNVGPLLSRGAEDAAELCVSSADVRLRQELEEHRAEEELDGSIHPVRHRLLYDLSARVRARRFGLLQPQELLQRQPRCRGHGDAASK